MAQGGPTLSAVGLVRENIVYDEDGQAYIPASQRPDGTWRNPRRVKEGYIPPDEIPVYQSKGRLLAKETSSAAPPGLLPADDGSVLAMRLMGFADDSEPGEKPLSRAQKKNVRKKQKKKEKKASEVAFEIVEVTSGMEDVTLGDKSPKQTNKTDAKTTQEKPSTIQQDTPSTTKDSGAPKETRGDGDTSRERLKRERALRKKLKQIKDLEVRIASGEISSPDQDQLTKIAKKADIEAELLELSPS